MDEAQHEIEQMVARRAPFTKIEVYIERRVDLTDEQRDALWLLAWSEQSLRTRRQVVREALVASSRPQG
jgi:hypothetical protein